jgi:hypothetical protein
MGCMCRRGAYVASASASELEASEGELDWGKGRGKVEAHAAGAAIDRWDRCRCRSRALRSRARPSHNVTRFVRRGDAWRAEASICRARLSGRQVGRQVGRYPDYTLECMDQWVDEQTADRATDVALEACRGLYNLLSGPPVLARPDPLPPTASSSPRQAKNVFT